MHPAVLRLLLLRALLMHAMQQRASMPGLGGMQMPGAAPQPQTPYAGTPQAQAHHGRGQAFQGEKGPAAAGRSRKAQMMRSGVPKAAAQRLTAEVGKQPVSPMPTGLPNLGALATMLLATHLQGPPR